MRKAVAALCVVIPLAIAGVLVAQAENSPTKTPSADEMRQALRGLPYDPAFRETQPNDDLDAFTGTMTKGSSTLRFVVIVGSGASDYVDGLSRELIPGVPNATASGYGPDGEVIVLDSTEGTGRPGANAISMSTALENAVASAMED
jgi:hypothetical protein